MNKRIVRKATAMELQIRTQDNYAREQFGLTLDVVEAQLALTEAIDYTVSAHKRSPSKR